MEVILIKDMENLGYANDIVNVKPGYANNYLIPQGYAKAATASAKKVLAENLRQRAHAVVTHKLQVRTRLHAQHLTDMTCIHALNSHCFVI